MWKLRYLIFSNDAESIKKAFYKHFQFTIDIETVVSGKMIITLPEGVSLGVREIEDILEVNVYWCGIIARGNMYNNDDKQIELKRLTEENKELKDMVEVLKKEIEMLKELCAKPIKIYTISSKLVDSEEKGELCLRR